MRKKLLRCLLPQCFRFFYFQPQLITKYGFPVEVHHVVTNDGYILELHRIPHGTKKGSGPKPGKDVVFLQHGFLASSADWIMNTVDKALGRYFLFDKLSLHSSDEHVTFEKLPC